jgi:hypothetical protein
MRALTTMLILVAAVAIGLLLAVSVGDPLITLVTSYDLAGMNSEATKIHTTLVKWVPVVGIATAVVWAVLRLLRTERQRGGMP